MIWHEALLIASVFAQACLTGVIYLRLLVLRLRQVRARQVRLKDVALSNDAWDLAAQKAGRNLSNQFELPVLFFACALLALGQGASSPALAVLLALFVVSRMVHAWIHLTSNFVPRRFFAFAAGGAFLTLAWAVLGLKLGLSLLA